MGLHSGSMIDGMIHLKLFSLIDGNSSTQSTLLLVLGYCLFIAFKNYNEDIRYFFRKFKNEKVIHFDLVQVAPTLYYSGKTEGNIISRSILFDIMKNKIRYNIPQVTTITTNGNAGEYLQIPDNGSFDNIHFLFEKKEIKLRNVTSCDKEERNSSYDKKQREKTTYKFELYSYSGMDHINSYVDYCIAQYEQEEDRKKNEFPMVYRYVNNGESCIDFISRRFHSEKTFTNLILPDEVVHEITSSLEKFFDHSENNWYKRTGHPRKLGILLWGPPGTGKTSVIKAITKYVNDKYKRMHLFNLDLSAITSPEEATELFMNPKLSNNIWFMEEFDRAPMVQKRSKINDATNNDNNNFTQADLDKFDALSAKEKSKFFENFKKKMGPENKKTGEVTTETFLKAIDGPEELNNVIYIATTNFKDNIDPAVLRRFELKIELKHHTKDAVSKQLEIYYEKVVPPVTLLPHNKLTGSQIDDICIHHKTLEKAIKEMQIKFLEEE